MLQLVCLFSTYGIGYIIDNLNKKLSSAARQHFCSPYPKCVVWHWGAPKYQLPSSCTDLHRLYAQAVEPPQNRDILHTYRFAYSCHCFLHQSWAEFVGFFLFAGSPICFFFLAIHLCTYHNRVMEWNLPLQKNANHHMKIYVWR